MFGVGVPGSGPIVQHLTLWVGFLGAAIAARDGKLLALASGTFIPTGPMRRASDDRLRRWWLLVSATILAWGGVELVLSERETGSTLGADIPTWVAQLVLPVGFALIALRLVWRASAGWGGRAIASVGIAVGIVVMRMPGCSRGERLAGPADRAAGGGAGRRPSSRFSAARRCCCS